MSIAEKVTRAKTDYDEVYEAGKQAEYDAFWDSYQRNGARNDYAWAFAGTQWNKTTFRPKHNMRPTRMYMMTYSPYGGGLAFDVAKRLQECGVTLDTSACTDFQYAFHSGTHWGVIDSTGTTNLNYQVFFNNSMLHTIDELIVKETTTFGATTFQGCSALANLKITGTIGKTITLSACPLTVESAKSVINALYNYAGTTDELKYKLTLKSTVWTALNNAETPPTGDTWQDYVVSLGWNCA